MAVSNIELRTKIITTADGDGVPLFDDPTHVYSIAVEVHEDSSVDVGWVGSSSVTTTNKNGRAISKTIPFEAQTRWRLDGGGQITLIDASTIYVAAAAGADILVTYLVTVNKGRETGKSA